MGHWGQRGKSPKNAVVLGKRNDKKWLKVQLYCRELMSSLCRSGMSKWGLIKRGLKGLVHNCPRLPEMVIILRRKFPLRKATEGFTVKPLCQGLLNGGVSNGGVSRSGLVRPSFFVLFCPFGTFPGIFPICSGMVWGFSRFVLFLFLGLLRAPTRNSPERVRDTIWTFPEKSGKHPGLETPRFSFSQL